MKSVQERLEFSTENEATSDYVVDVLRRYGISIVRRFAYGQMLHELRDEYDRIFSEEDDGIFAKHEHPANEGGKVARLNRLNLGRASFPTCHKVFESKFMEDIARVYFAPYGYVLNDEIFATYEVQSHQPILPWHYDRQQSLKFYIYLSETTRINGAFEYVPGSHREGRYRANYHLIRGIRHQDLPNDIPEDEIINPVTIDGSAGDLIIFDADGFHRGGVVQEGKERMVIRGHSHPLPKLPQRRSRLVRWIVQSRSKVADLLRDKVERQVGERIRSGEKRRGCAKS